MDVQAWIGVSGAGDRGSQADSSGMRMAATSALPTASLPGQRVVDESRARLCYVAMDWLRQSMLADVDYEGVSGSRPSWLRNSIWSK